MFCWWCFFMFLVPKKLFLHVSHIFSFSHLPHCGVHYWMNMACDSSNFLQLSQFFTFTTLWGSFSSSRKGFYLFCFLFCDCVRNCLIYLILKFTQSLSLRRASYDSVIEKPQKELHEMQAFHYVRGFPHITDSYGKCSNDLWGIFSKKYKFSKISFIKHPALSQYFFVEWWNQHW